MKKILVTGSSGFVGHHVVKKCKEKGYFVVGVDKRPIKPNHEVPDQHISVDVRDLGFRDLYGVDYVIHLGFSTNIPNSIRHPIETTEDNINMTVHLLEYAKDAEVKKFLFPSTASLYGHQPTPWKEDMEALPIDPYSWQKLSCEYACGLYSRVYGLPTVVTRLFQVYGENQREDTALAAFLKSRKEGRPITLTKTTAQSTFKSGQRDFVYAGDVAEAMIMLLESDAEGVYNISSGKVKTMEEIANAIEAQIVWIPRRKYEVERHHGDNSKLKSLGWKPKTNVIDWLKKQL